MKKEPCKYCEKEGTYSFGWLDRKGEWRDKHLTCDVHAPYSMKQQEFRMGLEQSADYWSRIFSEKPIYHLTSTP